MGDTQLIEGLLEACRIEARKTLNEDSSQILVETAALKVLVKAVEAEMMKYDAPAGSAPVCTAYRQNLQMIIGTWNNFAKQALAFLGGQPLLTEKELSSLPVPRRYTLHTRLYLGSWLRSGGKRLRPIEAEQTDFFM